MRGFRFTRKQEINELNRFLRIGAKETVQKSEERLELSILGAAGEIIDSGAKIVLISGPSASGKTSFAKRLCEVLNAAEAPAKLISLDDFYLGLDYLPRYEDGSYDMESIEGFDMALANKCFSELIETGRSIFPTFDFVSQSRAEKQNEIALPENGVLVIEGIYALYPDLTDGLPKEKVMKIYISPRVNYNSFGETVLSAKDVRLIRRMIRDELFRNWEAEKTLSQWKSVCEGEEKYITPFIASADMNISTSLLYEPSVLKKHALKMLENVDENSQYYPMAAKIAAALSDFSETEDEILTKESILHEFIG